MNLKYCIVCGFKLPENTNYCPQCGSSIKAMEEKIRQQQSNNTRSLQEPQEGRDLARPLPQDSSTSPIIKEPPVSLTSTTQVAQPQPQPQVYSQKVVVSPFFTKEEWLGIGVYTLIVWFGHAFRFIFLQDAFPSLTYLLVNLGVTSVFTLLLFFVYVSSARAIRITKRMRFFTSDYANVLMLTTFILGYLPDYLDIKNETSTPAKNRANVYKRLGYLTVGTAILLSAYIFFAKTSILSYPYGNELLITYKDIVLTASGITLTLFISSPLSIPSEVSKHMGYRQNIFVIASIVFIINALITFSLSYITQLM